MRRALAVACVVALASGASAADAKVIGEGGGPEHLRPPGHALRVQTGILQPSPAPVNSPTPVGGGLSWLTAEQVAGYARGAGFPEYTIATMVGYAARESGFNAHAINLSSGACGLWQLYPCYGGIAWLDPAANAAGAYQKWLASGFAPWGG